MERPASFFKNPSAANALLLFAISGIIGIAFSAISASIMIVLNVESFGTILTGQELFGDFIETAAYFFSENPYTGKANGIETVYLPISFLIIAPFAFLVRTDAKAYLAGSVTTANIHHSARFVAVYLLFFAFHLAVLLFILWRMSGFRGKEALVFLIGSACHGALLFTFGRANVIVIAFIGILLFFWLKDSESFWKREIGYLGLSLAIAIKIYPAILALMLIRDRKFFGLLRVGFYAALLGFLPFLAIEGGFANIPFYIRHLFEFTEEGRGLGFTNISIDGFFSKVFYFFELILKVDLTIPKQTVSYGMSFALLVFAVVISFFPETERTGFSYMAIISSTYVLFPVVSYLYVYLVFIPLTLVFFQEIETMPSKRRVQYAICLLTISFPYSYFWQSGPFPFFGQIALLVFAIRDFIKNATIAPSEVNDKKTESATSSPYN